MESKEPGRVYIPMMHVFPGLNYYPGGSSGEPIQVFYKDEFSKPFLGILDKHKEAMPLLLGSHVHRMAFRCPLSHDYPDLQIKVLATPSVTPVYSNNPGYTLLELEESD